MLTSQSTLLRVNDRVTLSPPAVEPPPSPEGAGPPHCHAPPSTLLPPSPAPGSEGEEVVVSGRTVGSACTLVWYLNSLNF